jgi:SsrA-binding protein
MHISKYTNRHYVDNNLDERSSRKLLLHKEEIKKIKSALAEKGYSLVPTKIYLSKNRAKIEIALVKGKKNHDKRQSLKEKDQKREMEKVMKNKW